jgi:hypothetical protein
MFVFTYAAAANVRSANYRWHHLLGCKYGCHHLLMQKWRKKIAMPLTQRGEPFVGPNVSEIPALTSTVLQISGLILPYLHYTLFQGMVMRSSGQMATF